MELVNSIVIFSEPGRFAWAEVKADAPSILRSTQSHENQTSVNQVKQEAVYWRNKGVPRVKATQHKA